MSDKKVNAVEFLLGKMEENARKKIERVYGQENNIVFDSFAKYVNKEYEKQKAILIHENYIALRKKALKKIIKRFCH